MTSDLDLARRMADGDQAAVEQLHRLHGAALERFCSRLLGDPDEGADAAQETWLRALQRLRRGGSEVQSVRPWLFAIARNQCADRAVARRTAADALEDPDAVPSPIAGPGEAFEARQDLHELLDDLAALSGAQRSALVLREVGGLGYDDVAQELGARPDRVQWLVSDARRALTERRAGRAMPCGEVRRDLLARRRRDRRLSAHLEACDPCQGYLQRARARTLHTRILAPLVVLAGWLRGLAGRGGPVAPMAADPVAVSAVGRSAAALAAVVVAVAGVSVEAGRDAERPAPGTSRAAVEAGAQPADAVAAAAVRGSATAAPTRAVRRDRALRGKAGAVTRGRSEGPRAVGRPAPAAADVPAAPAPPAAVPQQPRPAAAPSPAAPARELVRDVRRPVQELERGVDRTVETVAAPVRALVETVAGAVRPLVGEVESTVAATGARLRAAQPSGGR